MSRPTRMLRRKFEVFCEGDTEYNYINHMRRKQGVEISLRPINMKGGGYGNFLNEIKTKGQVNCHKYGRKGCVLAPARLLPPAKPEEGHPLLPDSGQSRF